MSLFIIFYINCLLQELWLNCVLCVLCIFLLGNWCLWILHLLQATSEVKVSLSKGKRSSHNTTQSKAGKMVKPTEHTSSSTDLGRERNDSALSTLQVSSADQVKPPTKVRSRRKMDVQKPVLQNDSKSSGNMLNEHPNIPSPSLHERALALKVGCS